MTHENSENHAMNAPTRRIPHGVEARSVITGYVRTGVALARQHGDAINGIPHGAAMLSLVLGRTPTELELLFAAQETLREVRALAGHTTPTRRAALAGLLAAFMTTGCFNPSGSDPTESTTMTSSAATEKPTSGTSTSESSMSPPTSTATSESSSGATSPPTSSTSGPTCYVGEYGPMHTFVGLTSSIYMTQGCCAPECALKQCDCGFEDIENIAGNAMFFCEHFYGPNCSPKRGYQMGMEPSYDVPKMHNGAMCTSDGLDIPGTDCFGTPCKIGIWQEAITGIVDLVCTCADCGETGP